MELAYSKDKDSKESVKKGKSGENTSAEVVEARIVANTAGIAKETGWLNEAIITRMTALREKGLLQEWKPLHELIPIPVLNKSSYLQLVDEYQLDYAERLLLVLCFCTGYKPGILDMLLMADPVTKQRFRIVGGRVDKETGTFIPTLQTAIFLLAGGDDHVAAKYLYQLRDSNKLFKEQILHLKYPVSNTGFQPAFEVRLDRSYYNYFLFGERPRLDEGEHFPARLLETDKTFKDLILPKSTLDSLKAPMDYIRNQQKVFAKSGVDSKINAGHVMMLYGPPGTGKTLTASVIGKHLGVDVYAIELSQVVSKYIGETEKNIDRIFDRLQDKNCIIFFDEADALFGKRTEIKDAKDKFANQETSHLLQKVEHCRALVILASNYRQNLDDAFKRRILTYVHVPPPEEAERLKMWLHALPGAYQFEPTELPERLAADYQLTGANIANIIKLTCFDAEADGTDKLTFDRLEHFISKELIKENRSNPIGKPGGEAKSRRASSKGDTPPVEVNEPPPPPPEPENPKDLDFGESRVMAMSEAEARRKGLLPMNSPAKKTTTRSSRGKRR